MNRCFLHTLVLFTAVLLAGRQPAAAQEWRHQADSALIIWQNAPGDADHLFELAVLNWPSDSLDTKSFSLCIRTWAHSNLQRGNGQQAFTITRAAIGRLEKAGLHQSATCVELQTVLGLWLFEAGRSGTEGALDESVHWFRAALNSTRQKEGTGSEAYARICNNLASVLITLGKYPEAEVLLQQSILARASIPAREEGYAKSCNSLGNLYWQTGRFKEAKEKYREAAAMFRKIGGTQSLFYAQVRYNLGLVEMALGDYGPAEMSLLKARSIRAELLGENDPAVATATVALGRLYGQMGQYRRGLQWITEARVILGKKSKASYNYADACSGLAGLFSAIDSIETAVSLYQEALGILRTIVGEQHNDYLATATNLSNALISADRLNEALRLLLGVRQSLETEEQTESQVYLAVLSNIGQVYLRQNRLKDARLVLDSALAQVGRLFGQGNIMNTEVGIHRAMLAWKERNLLQADSFFNLCVNSYFGAIESLAAFTSIPERHNYAAQYAGGWDLAFSFYAQERVASAVPMQLAIRLKGYLLASEQQFRKAVAGISDTATLNKYQHWAELRKKLANLPANADSSGRVEIQQEIFLLEKLLTRASAAFGDQALPPDWSKLKASLGKHDALILFTEFSNTNAGDSLQYLAIMLRPEWPLPRVVRLFRRHELEDRFRVKNTPGIFYRGIKAGNGKQTDSAAGHLIWGPLEPFLGGVQRVYYVPDGLLHQVAFAALSIHPDTLLSEKYELRQLTSAATLANRVDIRFSTRDAIDLYGGIEYGNNANHSSGLLPRGSWSYLPGTLSEIRNIESTAVAGGFPVKSFSANAASEALLKSRSATNAPAILHVATHGYFLAADVTAGTKRNIPGPMYRSGLLLSGALAARDSTAVEDGLLTASEVAGLALDSTRLVVLSACETGLGEIDGTEGVFGLQRGFKMAGANYLVISLWKVPDEETAAFMSEFYRHLFSGQTIEMSFDEARATMRSRYRNQFDTWAAWVLVH
ncbi:MAG: CHAT domain-containing protein [Chitinophagaceae bacterium]|nr:MAG: CHAT domain-containing protein [Chitinophagaceae bacterium]